MSAFDRYPRLNCNQQEKHLKLSINVKL